MCVLISEHSLLGVKGFIGAVLVLLGAQAGGPGLLQGCSLCGSVKPVTPSLLSHCGQASLVTQDTFSHFGGKLFGAKISKLLPVEPRQFPSVPVSPCSSQRAACTFSSWTERGERFWVCSRYLICARPGRETSKLSDEGSLYIEKCNWILYCKTIVSIRMMWIVSMFHLSRLLRSSYAEIFVWDGETGHWMGGGTGESLSLSVRSWVQSPLSRSLVPALAPRDSSGDTAAISELHLDWQLLPTAQAFPT